MTAIYRGWQAFPDTRYKAFLNTAGHTSLVPSVENTLDADLVQVLKGPVKGVCVRVTQAVGSN